MPSHKIHDRIGTIIVTLLILPQIYFEIDYINIIIFSLAFLFATYYLSPDLDLDSKIYKRWKVLKILWCPYKELFKHRQLSHNIILGPISIISYFTFLILGFLLLIKSVPGTLDIRIITVYIGFFISMEIHIISDIIIKPKKDKKKK